MKLFGRIKARNFTLHGLYGDRDKAIPTASFGTVFNNPGSRTIERQGYIDLAYERTMASQWDVASRVYLDHYRYDGDYIFERADGDVPGPVLNKDFARGNWWGAEMKADEEARWPTHCGARLRVSQQLQAGPGEL